MSSHGEKRKYRGFDQETPLIRFNQETSRNRWNPRKKQKLIHYLEENDVVKKYWFQRYSLFSKYDLGIQMDQEGWYSVTPEEIAIRQARNLGGRGGKIVVDGFCGVGGNSIQFARLGYHVIAIDIDPYKVKLAYNNANIYGVQDHIDFIVGDFFELASSLKGDVVFLSPPWGGPSYSAIEKFTLDLLKPKDGYSVFQAAQDITPNIIMFLPRNIDLRQLHELSWLSSPPLHLEVEHSYVDGRLKGVTAYFSDPSCSQRLNQLL